MITKSIWSFTAVDFLDCEFIPVKGKTHECSPTLTLECRQRALIKSDKTVFLRKNC